MKEITENVIIQAENFEWNVYFYLRFLSSMSTDIHHDIYSAMEYNFQMRKFQMWNENFYTSYQTYDIDFENLFQHLWINVENVFLYIVG